MEDPDLTEGERNLRLAWFDAILVLRELALMAESSRDRIYAASEILKYGIALGQSINLPYIPASRPEEAITRDEEDDDNEE